MLEDSEKKELSLMGSGTVQIASMVTYLTVGTDPQTEIQLLTAMRATLKIHQDVVQALLDARKGTPLVVPV